MDNIEDIVKDVMGKMAGRGPSSFDRIKKIWPEILSKTERKHTSLVGIKEDKIVVDVDSPASLFHLNSKKKTLLKKIQKHVPEVREINFHISKQT